MVPLVALFMTVLLGMAALAIDVSRALTELRFQRSVADAAALAGAQDLQLKGTRTVGLTEYANARTDAMRNLLNQLSGPGAAFPDCGQGTPYQSDVLDCQLPGSDYAATIKTPSPTCVSCAPDRAVQVAIRRLSFSLTFARVLGQTNWNLGTTSVAGLVYSKSYTLVTLRPPNPKGKPGQPTIDGNRQNVNVNGTNSVVNILRGDIGSNTTVVTNSSSRVNLDPGFSIYHWDVETPDPWNNGSGTPPGIPLYEQIPEPAGYSFPTATGPVYQTYATQSAGEDLGCVNKPVGLVMPLKPEVDPATINLKCYKPGIYQQDFNVQQANDAAYLESDATNGVFVFHGNVTLRGYIFGGITDAAAGVVIVMDQDKSFDGATAEGVTLNVGSTTCSGSLCRASPAIDPATLGPVESPDGLPLTFMIHTDDTCFVPLTAPRMPQLCTSSSSTSNTGTNVLSLTGNGLLSVAGVVWAPTDNVQVASNFGSQAGTVGRIISWTVTYSGGAALNQEGTPSVSMGILRLDAACTAGEPCNP